MDMSEIFFGDKENNYDLGWQILVRNKNDFFGNNDLYIEKDEEKYDFFENIIEQRFFFYCCELLRLSTCKIKHSNEFINDDFFNFLINNYPDFIKDYERKSLLAINFISTTNYNLFMANELNDNINKFIEKISLTSLSIPHKISLRKSIPTLPFNIYSLDNDTFYKKRKESFDFYGFNNRNRFLDLIKYFLLHDAIIDDKSLFSNLLINEIAKNYTDNVSNIYQGFMEYFYKTKHYKEHLLDRPEKIINQIKNLNIRFEVKESNIITFLINNKFKSPINNHKCFLELYNEEISESLNKYNIHHYKLFDYFLNINKYSNNSIDTLIEYLDYFYNHLQKHPEFHNNSSIIDDNYDIDMYNFISKMLVKYHNDIEIVTNDLNKKIEIIFAPDFELCSITENANINTQ